MACCSTRPDMPSEVPLEMPHLFREVPVIWWDVGGCPLEVRADGGVEVAGLSARQMLRLLRWATHFPQDGPPWQPARWFVPFNFEGGHGMERIGAGGRHRERAVLDGTVGTGRRRGGRAGPCGVVGAGRSALGVAQGTVVWSAQGVGEGGSVVWPAQGTPAPGLSAQGTVVLWAQGLGGLVCAGGSGVGAGGPRWGGVVSAGGSVQGGRRRR